MRSFESWWEFVPTATRFATLVMALLAMVLLKPLGHYWE